MPVASFDEAVRLAANFSEEAADRMVAAMSLAEAVHLAEQKYLTLEECSACLHVFTKNRGLLHEMGLTPLVSRIKGKADGILMAVETRKS